jgi:predicted dehydrogenase
MRDRRKFLKDTAGLTLGAALAPHIIPAFVLGRGATAPSDRILIGSIGVGQQGSGVMRNFLAQEAVRVVAVCDVKKPVLDAARQHVNDQNGDQECAAYHDFRELLARKDIDAVTVAPPDHWHVPIAIAAANAGKDIYLEKPMGLSVAQDQALRAACLRNGTIFQFGTQQRSNDRFRFACELVRNGRIGELRAIKVWSPASTAGGPTTPVPVPAGLDYDMWLGPAPYAPYTEDRCSNKYWWFVSDYALGFIAGWGIHPLDIALWGGGDRLMSPVDVEGTGVFPQSGLGDTAVDWDVHFTYSSGVNMHFTGKPLQEWKKYGRLSDHGTAFEGSEGWAWVDREGLAAFPKKLESGFIGPADVHLYKSPDHAKNLVDCVRSRRPTICPIEEAVRADIVCQIADIAIRTRQKLRWDPASESFAGNDKANRYLARPMRSPWQI